MAEVVFLGTGDAFSAGRRSNVALLIEDADFRMLVEAGPMVMQQLARANVQAVEIDQLFVSHSHGDHVLGFPMFALNRSFESSPRLNVYAGSNTIATLKMLWSLVFTGYGSHRLKCGWHNLSERNPDMLKLSHGAILRTAVSSHPPGMPTLAARWDFADGASLTFATDTLPCDSVIELARGSDLLIHEATFSAELQPYAEPAAYFHSTALQAGEIARLAGCPRLALVHLGLVAGEHPDVLVGEARAGTDLQVIVPEDGERISVS
ncbi:MAG: MBL fold metallo-hydrolase [Chloroflexi bacterium]|nr:MBL fold metallo-hydrolase [Chloroflexota bacterium]